jgi:hypothetical protein
VISLCNAPILRHNLQPLSEGVDDAGRVPQFSRKTVLAAIDFLPYNQGQFTRFLLDLGPEVVDIVRGEDVSVEKRCSDLIRYYDGWPSRMLDDGSFLSDFVVERAASHVREPPKETAWGPPREEKDSLKRFRAALERDGFTVVDRTLRRVMPVELGIDAAEDEVTRILTQPAFQLSLGHLTQALDAHGLGDWAAATRAFYDEALLDDFANAIDPAMAAGGSEARRQRLATEGCLRTELNEWGAEGKNYINGLMKRLHPHGAHPGLSDEKDCTFRLHVVLLTARLLLERWEAGRQ